jgi:IS30 family transposase
MDDSQVKRAVALRRKERSVRAIATALGVPRVTVHRTLRAVTT